MTSAEKAGVLALTQLVGTDWYDVDKLWEAKQRILAAPSNPYQGLALGQVNNCLGRCPR